MKTWLLKQFCLIALCCGPMLTAFAADQAIQSPISERFSDKNYSQNEETPDFRRHTLPLMGRLGCNGRACHGSFQGQGGFRLSLFGYDFQADHDAMLKGESPRVNLKDSAKSMVLTKPSLEEDHEGGKRMEKNSWQYRVLAKWIEKGAIGWDDKAPDFAGLEVTPAEIIFKKPGEAIQLRVIAKWKDGTREDVTAISRFRTNDESLAKIDENGLVTCLNKGDTHVVAFYDNGVFPVPTMLPVSANVNEKYPSIKANTKVDELVINKLRKVGVVPSDVCSDEDYLRRIRLDMTGTLPLPAEIESFLADKSPNKRLAKVEELLNTPEYVAWWTTKLNDLTGNNPQSINNNNIQQNQRGFVSQQWYNWIYDRVAKNMPYDQIVAGIVLANSLEPGQDYKQYSEQLSADWRDNNNERYADRQTLAHYWSRRNFRTTEEKVLGFAYTFMGIQIQCAQCHKHPFDQWTKQDFDAFKPFFDRVTTALPPEHKATRDELMKALGTTKDPQKEQQDYRKEIEAAVKAGKTYPAETLLYSKAPQKVPAPKVVNKNDKEKKDKNAAPTFKPIMARVLGGESVDLLNVEDPRTLLMDWLRNDPNKYLARAFVNRVWANYFNVGIIHPTDDASLANPPSNAALLSYLTDGFIANKYDMKWLHREIVKSDAYQRDWKPNDTNKFDTRNFSRAIPRRIPAEITYDAIVVSTAGEKERETYLAKVKDRAIGVASTLAQGGKLGYPLAVFGKPERATNCDCERSNEPSLLQCVFTQNDGELLTMLDRNQGWIKQFEQQALAIAREKQAVERKAPDAEEKTKTQREDRKNMAKLIERRIEKLKAAGKNDEIPALEKKLAELQGPSAANNAVPTPATMSIDNELLEKTIKEAFLRTLSRQPSVEEIDRAKEHFASSNNPGAGLKDLMWALINTKEFIINH
jgi:hypothetical protein